MASTLAKLTVGFVALIATVSAGSAPKGHKYRKPGKTDVRSPCPGLNSLANHGFLPRSGKGMSVPILIQGLDQGLNVGIDFASAVGLLGLQSAPDPLATTFNLDDLDEHNFPIEHDGSLSRQDAYSGDDHTFNQGVFDQVLKYYENTTTATIPLASLARINRIDNARAINPDFIYGPRQLVFSYGETALYLSTMGDPITGEAPVSYIKSLFEKQQLPYALGWQKSSVTTTFATLGAMAAQLQAANPEAVPEGLTLGEGALRDVTQLINPLTGKLQNATCILANTC